MNFPNRKLALHRFDYLKTNGSASASTGISRPSSANDGMVRMALVSAVATADPAGLRYTATPTPTPINAASIVHWTTALTCSNDSLSNLLHRSLTKSQKLTALPGVILEPPEGAQ